MADKKQRNTTGQAPAVDTPAAKTSLRRYFAEQADPHRRDKMAPAAQTRGSQPSSPTASEGSTEDQEIRTLLTQLPSKADLAAMFQKLEDSFSEKLQAVAADVQQLGARVQDLEEEAEHINKRGAEAYDTQETYAEAIRYLQRRLDDVDNRGRRNNLRVRGIPESAEGATENPIQVLTTLFNRILARPKDTAITFDRAHRAARPRNLPPDKPRDLICRIHNFPLKEEIFRKARQNKDLTTDGQPVTIFQDLAPSTLQARRALRPITQALLERQIKFRWNFPFALTVNLQNKTHTITSPEDVPDFQRALKLPPSEVEDWTGLAANQTRQTPQKPKWQRSPRKRRRQNHPGTDISVPTREEPT
ncbi:Hypothetical predicted protein [Pelobates cultripes]|uniref:Uncharacterized protein n=1 Tax=Pelobates cultripes TaxID=61616 RepID=A0AAD1WNI6_PELCU|nr:Hypothetical predicted protein [Pelobates cultripes]